MRHDRRTRRTRGECAGRRADADRQRAAQQMSDHHTKCLRGSEVSDAPIRFAPDGRWLYVLVRGLPTSAVVYRIDLATGEYVGFVDGDDVLLPAYADLVRRAVVDGVHVATGAVNRTDGERDWPSSLHARALQDVGDHVVLVDDPSLIFDTTAWNKVYRRPVKRRGVDPFRKTAQPR